MFNNKKINMLLSLVIAIALWAYVMGEVNPSQTKLIKDIPVQFEHQEELEKRGLAVASTELTTDVTVKGDKKALSDLGPRDFTATVDLADCVEGDNVLEVDIETKKDVTRETESTITVHVNIDRIISVEKKIRAEYTGEKEPGDGVEFQLLSADTVTVTGARSLVDKVSYVRAEVKELSAKDGADTVDAKLVPVSEDGRRVANVQLSADSVQVMISQMVSKSVKLKADVKGTLADGYTFDGMDVPKEVIIIGRQNEIGDITEVEAERIDISGFTETKKVKLEIRLPEGVSLSSESAPVMATIHISKEESEEEPQESEVTIGKDEISLSGLEEGFSAEVTSEEMTFLVEGTENAKSSDFTLEADLSGLEEGEQEVELSVKYKGDGSLKSGPEKITVVITAPEETEE